MVKTAVKYSIKLLFVARRVGLRNAYCMYGTWLCLLHMFDFSRKGIYIPGT